MSKHTPGPWEFIGDGLFGDITVDSQGKKVCRQQIHPFHCEDRQQGLHGQRHEADKRLIAAAPELLAALQRLADAGFSRDVTMGDPCSLIACKAELYDAVKHARAAIAKATAE